MVTSAGAHRARLAPALRSLGRGGEAFRDIICAAELVRAAAPVCYQLRQARLPRLPLQGPGVPRAPATVGGATRGPSAVAARAIRMTRPRDARRVDAHRARLAARGLRRKAPVFISIGYPAGFGQVAYVDGKAGRRGRKAEVPLPAGRTS